MRFKSRLSERISRWFGAPAWRRELSHEARRRGPLTHIVILDGTMSTLEPGEETNAGLTFKLLQELGPHISLYYEAGVQWRRMPDMIDVMMGRGINRQILAHLVRHTSAGKQRVLEKRNLTADVQQVAHSL